MEQITKPELVEQIEKGLVDLHLGTFEVGGEFRTFYRSYRGAASESTGFKIVYVVE